jgi:hypothetical protein
MDGNEAAMIDSVTGDFGSAANSGVEHWIGATGVIAADGMVRVVCQSEAAEVWI